MVDSSELQKQHTAVGIFELNGQLFSDAIISRAKKCQLLILDVDGVLTDGKLFFDQQGTEYKSFHARDGHGIKLLQQSGVKVAVISGRKSAIVELRMKNLGVELIYQGYEHKTAAYHEILQRLDLEGSQVAFVGDDVIDLPIMVRVGLSIAVQDAHFSVKEHVHWTTHLLGGNGAVREVCDLIMQAQGTYANVVKKYLVC